MLQISFFYKEKMNEWTQFFTPLVFLILILTKRPKNEYFVLNLFF
jgi:hypothetical protein